MLSRGQRQEPCIQSAALLIPSASASVSIRRPARRPRLPSPRRRPSCTRVRTARSSCTESTRRSPAWWSTDTRHSHRPRVHRNGLLPSRVPIQRAGGLQAHLWLARGPCRRRSPDVQQALSCGRYGWHRSNECPCELNGVSVAGTYGDIMVNINGATWSASADGPDSPFAYHYAKTVGVPTPSSMISSARRQKPSPFCTTHDPTIQFSASASRTRRPQQRLRLLRLSRTAASSSVMVQAAEW